MKNKDYIIIALICFFLGIFIVSQYLSTKSYKKAVNPENNAVMAIEVAKLTKTNADLRQDVKKLTAELDLYKNSSESKQAILKKYIEESEKLDLINGELEKSGQGVLITIKGKMAVPQVIDLINAIKNIGSSLIAINGERIIIDSDLAKFANQNEYQITVLGNSNLLKSSITRKGGIVDQIQTKDLSIIVTEVENMTLPKSQSSIKFDYSTIIYK